MKMPVTPDIKLLKELAERLRQREVAEGIIALCERVEKLEDSFKEFIEFVEYDGGHYEPKSTCGVCIAVGKARAIIKGEP
jgi:hypothetical protein